MPMSGCAGPPLVPDCLVEEELPLLFWRLDPFVGEPSAEPLPLSNEPWCEPLSLCKPPEGDAERVLVESPLPLPNEPCCEPLSLCEVPEGDAERVLEESPEPFPLRFGVSGFFKSFFCFWKSLKSVRNYICVLISKNVQKR